MNLIDSHAHICAADFDTDRKIVIDRAVSNGVTGIIAVSETLADAEKNLELSRNHPQIFPAAGLYPTHLDWDDADAMVSFIRAHQMELVGIGEVGLDYWKVQDEADREIQREIFRRFISLSNALEIPINVHSRSAGKYTVAILLEAGARRVHMHAFDGKPSAALPGIEAGFMFSIPPSILRSRQKQKLVKRVPLDNLMIETDSPVLGPDPHARNEPSNAAGVLDAIAEIKGMSRDKVLETIYQNTIGLYTRILSTD